jgi:hypothetical protein
MRLALLAAAATLAATTANAQPPGDALTDKAQACIRAAAPKVASAAQSLTDAVDFLVNDLCSVEIQRAANYAANSQRLADWAATSASAQLVGVSVDPATGDLKTPPGFSPPFNAATTMLSVYRMSSQGSEYRALAAREVLAARAAPAR